MAITSEFKDIVEKGNLIRTRIMLKDSLLVNSSGDNFKTMLEYAENHIESLFDEHDGETFKGQEDWDENYLNEQLVKVVSNFSKDRIDLLLMMVQILYKSEKNTPHSTQKESPKPRLTSMQKAGISVATVGTVTAVIGIVFRTSMVWPILGGISMIAGGALYFIDKKKNSSKNAL